MKKEDEMDWVERGLVALVFWLRTALFVILLWVVVALLFGCGGGNSEEEGRETVQPPNCESRRCT